MDFGKAAKNRTGKIGVKTFKGFKMLLPEDLETARRRGYTDKYTPEYITERYLENILTSAIQYYHRGTQVERLVICVPEIWFQSVKSVNARAKLREICRKYLFVHQVQIVSEPSAACAFFAYNYYRNTNRKELYDGQILLIDYGGGTLDITLTEINPCREKDQPGLMEIRVLEQTGAGENADGEIGEAGIAYMENVMERSLRRFGVEPPADGFRTDPRFLRAVDRLEEDLQSMTGSIRNTYNAFGTDNPSDIMEEVDEFTTIEYGDKDIPIRFSVMLEVYKERIYPVLDAKLEEMIAYMNEKKIPFMERNSENFKIALVGGFGNFYLVSKQIEEKFAFSSSDHRRQGIISRSPWVRRFWRKASSESAIQRPTRSESSPLGVWETAGPENGGLHLQILQSNTENRSSLSNPFLPRMQTEDRFCIISPITALSRLPGVRAGICPTHR